MGSLSKGSILIVDDAHDNLRILRDTLQDAGYKVRSCSTGTMALRAANAAIPDLILLDIKLPDYNGYEVCKKLKKNAETAQIPIIFLSGLTSTIDKVQGFNVGGADYITKPFQIEEVLARVATHLSIKHLQKHLEDRNLRLTQEITEHKRTQEALFFEKEFAQVTLKSIGDAVITTDTNGYVTYLNPIAEHLTGWTEAEAQGLHLFEVFHIINRFSQEIAENPFVQALEQLRIVNLADNTLLISRHGIEIPISDSAAPILDRQGNVIGAVIVFRDITESYNLTRQLSWQATHDSLTGLLNRLGFEQALDAAISATLNEDQDCILCYLDLDQFKVINDTCGHAAGDELLISITKILRQRIRDTDTLARLGGDEFAFLLHKCSLEKAVEIAETSRETIKNFPFTWQDKSFSIGVSIGVVAIDANIKDKNQVLGIADAACYAAKGKGRNYVQVYQASDQELLQQRRERQWVIQIQQALEENRFCLYYQTVTPIQNKNKATYYEILVRLLNPKGQIVTPNLFLPSAERYDLMPSIDRWVISSFLKQYRDFYDQNRHRMDFSQRLYALNLSGASINQAAFFDFLQEQLEQAQIPLNTLCFELTENTAIANFDQAIKLMTRIKQLGCYFALDDFGSGMNSFNYIKQFPIDFLKIDGKFVRNLVKSPLDLTIVDSFNRMSHIMNLQTIAEFVENATILEQLDMMSVDYAQGYHIAKPIPLDFDP